jgi:hypothetical protein
MTCKKKQPQIAMTRLQPLFQSQMKNRISSAVSVPGDEMISQVPARAGQAGVCSMAGALFSPLAVAAAVGGDHRDGMMWIGTDEPSHAPRPFSLAAHIYAFR